MSTPCKYFLRGTCRYGDRCRFYHPTDGAQLQQPNYFAGGQGQGGGQGQRGGSNYDQMQNSREKMNDSLRQIEQMVKGDMIEWEKGHIWPFSCYGPTGGKSNLEGFEDLSPEELRWATMQNNGVVPNNVAMRIQLWNRARAKWQQTTQDNLATLEHVILGTPKPVATGSQFQQGQPAGVFGGTQSSPFGGAASAPFGSTNFANPGASFGPTKPSAAMSSFSFSLGSTNASQAQSMEAGPMPQAGAQALSSFSFNQPGFGQPQAQQAQGFPSVPGLAPAAQSFPGGMPQPQGPSSIFGGVQQPQQQQSGFGQGFPSAAGIPSQPPTFASSMSAQQPHMNPPAFQSNLAPQQPQSGMNQASPFAPAQTQAAPAPSPFGQPPPFGGGPPAGFFGGAQLGATPTVTGVQPGFGFNMSGGSNPSDMETYESTIYSKLSDLTPNEIQAFEAPLFDSNTLPLHAPAKKFCF